jgi:carboxymethylenebutenolidase
MTRSEQAKRLPTGREVTLQVSGHDALQAYMVEPEQLPAPGIILLQEIFGVNAFVRRVAQEFARDGYVAIAPDLFWRQEAGVQLDSDNDADRARALALAQTLDPSLALADAGLALNYLRVRPRICSGKVGAIGFCLGGKLSYLMAARSDVDAAISYYGVAIGSALGEAPNIRAPLLLHIAGADHLCPPADQHRIVEALAPYSRVDVETYAGAGHGFARYGSPGFNPDATERAGRVTRAFLNRHLRSASDAGDASSARNGSTPSGWAQ